MKLMITSAVEAEYILFKQFYVFSITCFFYYMKFTICFMFFDYAPPVEPMDVKSIYFSSSFMFFRLHVFL